MSSIICKIGNFQVGMPSQRLEIFVAVEYRHIGIDSDRDNQTANKFSRRFVLASTMAEQRSRVFVLH